MPSPVMTDLDGMFHIAATRDDLTTVCGRQVGRVTSFKQSTWGHPVVAPTECKKEGVRPVPGEPAMWCRRCSKLLIRVEEAQMHDPDEQGKPGRKRSLTDEEVAEAQRMADGGVKIRDIGKHFTVSEATIRRHGVKCPRGRRPAVPHKPMTPAMKREAVRLVVKQKFSQEAAAKKLGVSQDTVWRAVTRYKKRNKVAPDPLTARLRNMILHRLNRRGDKPGVAARSLGISRNLVYRCMRMEKERAAEIGHKVEATP